MASNAAGYGSTNNLPSRYGNNVQITTSRITTDRNADSSGGNVVSSRHEISGGGNVINSSSRQQLSGNGVSSSGSAGKYQFYQSKYDKK